MERTLNRVVKHISTDYIIFGKNLKQGCQNNKDQLLFMIFGKILKQGYALFTYTKISKGAFKNPLFRIHITFICGCWWQVYHLPIYIFIHLKIFQSNVTIFIGISQLIAYLSKHMDLEPGDVILTGTPAGLGVAR